MRRTSLATLLAALAGLSACNTVQREVVQAPAAPRGIEGSWAADGGAVAYNATFTAGRYTATEASTGAILAEGTYRNLGPGQITMEYTSRVRGTRFAANCNQIAAGRLACVTSSGTRSDLIRRG